MKSNSADVQPKAKNISKHHPFLIDADTPHLYFFFHLPLGIFPSVSCFSSYSRNSDPCVNAIDLVFWFPESDAYIEMWEAEAWKAGHGFPVPIPPHRWTSGNRPMIFYGLGQVQSSQVDIPKWHIHSLDGNGFRLIVSPTQSTWTGNIEARLHLWVVWTQGEVCPPSRLHIHGRISKIHFSVISAATTLLYLLGLRWVVRAHVPFKYNLMFILCQG